MSDFAARRTMMVDTQVRPSDVTKFQVIEAMLDIPREDFVPASRRSVAYTGENLDIGNGRVLLEPRTLAKLVDALDIQPDELVLDLGCGYGYSAAVMSRMAEAVVAIEDSEELATEAETRLSDAGMHNVAVLKAELTEGAPKQGPYDVILIEGAVEEDFVPGCGGQAEIPPAHIARGVERPFRRGASGRRELPNGSTNAAVGLV